ncbi:NAD(P)H-dependent oxidoreductase [Aestuariivirga sp.]|uniref:NAD(P)H-dependent oxidoreductase n=1 Tax=Aestuariivirga sp. TaxID=2650926 RepID=UPI00391B01BA
MIRGVSPLVAELEARAAAGRPVTIGLAGCGQMGTDIVVQLARMPGLRLGAVAEMRPPQARAAAALAGFGEDRTVYADTSSTIDSAIERGLLAITQSPEALARSGHIDVVIDATGNPDVGTQFALDAIANGKHVVMLNVEADITIGRHLHAEARRAGVVYTGAAGDEPAATLELIGFAQSIGLEIVCAGKGKNNPLKFDAVPAEYEAEARARNMNARMLVEFVDGSKTMIEMVAIANCTGLVPDVPGMHGPAATREELASVLIPREHGGVLSRKGCVDYSIGKGVAPGVFCVVTTDHPRLQERLVDLKLGQGPYFALLRPYHLTSLEVPLSAARAVLHRQADMVPLEQPVAEAVTLAKRDLMPGEVLGRIGETDYRAWAMTHAEARNANAMPLGLAQGARVVKPVKAGQHITYDNCVPDESLVVTRIRRRLDQSDTRFHQL